MCVYVRYGLSSTEEVRLQEIDRLLKAFEDSPARKSSLFPLEGTPQDAVDERAEELLQAKEKGQKDAVVGTSASTSLAPSLAGLEGGGGTNYLLRMVQENILCAYVIALLTCYCTTYQ